MNDFWKKNRRVVFGCTVEFIIVFYFFFYRKFLYGMNDFGLHMLFSQGIFSMSIEEMVVAGYPTQAITYPVFHVILKCIAYIVGGDFYLAGAIILALSNGMAIILYRKLLDEMIVFRGEWEKVFGDAISIGAVVFVTARCGLNDWRFYSLQCAANPLHNPTIIFVRPFAILSFIFFLRFISQYLSNKKTKKNLLLFGCFTMLSAWTKPSYALVFLPAMGIFVLYNMIKTKDIRLGVESFLAVLPTLILMIWQFVYVSDNTGMLSVRVDFGTFSNFSVKEAIFASLVTFPVPLILLSWRILRENNYYCIAYLALCIGWIQMYFLTNGGSGDFSWGYDLAVQVCTLVSLALAKQYNVNKVRQGIAYLIFAYQSFSGVLYIYRAYMEGAYWF